MKENLSPIVLDIAYDIAGDVKKFQEMFSDREVYNLQADDAPSDLSCIRYALVWKPRPDLYSRMPDLEVIFSVGAGVDHILNQGNVPDLPIVRFVDPTLTNRMSEWVCLQCLMHLRMQKHYERSQNQILWAQEHHPQACELRVGIMGLGELGQDAAKKLDAIGFQVAGWSRSKKEISGIDTYDADGLEAFLSRTEILVGLLPSTPDTAGIFNRSLFEKLVQNTPIGGPVFVNAGRGKSQVETDIISCLEDGVLGGISLDVFDVEPLPEDSPLWAMPNAYLTPHTAAESDSTAMARYVSGQINRYETGQVLENVVDRSLGY